MLSSSQILRSCKEEGCQMVCWALFFSETWRDDNSPYTTAKTKQSSNPVPTTTNGWTSCSTTASFTLSILVGKCSVPALLGITFESCCKNFHQSQWTKKTSVGLSRQLPMMTAWFNIFKERLACHRMLPMLTLRPSAGKNVPISALQSTSPTPPKPMTSDALSVWHSH